MKILINPHLFDDSKQCTEDRIFVPGKGKDLSAVVILPPLFLSQFPCSYFIAKHSLKIIWYRGI